MGSENINRPSSIKPLKPPESKIKVKCDSEEAKREQFQALEN